MKISILTLFPETFSGFLQSSIIKRAQDHLLHHAQPPVAIDILNIRDFATNKRNTTDDRPYGGGPGMVMKVEPIDKALESLSAARPTKNYTARTLLTSAKGQMFTQQKAVEYAQLNELVIVCGHYEGVDERVAQHLVDQEVRIGDYVLTGGEPAAMVITDAVTRLLPGVLGNAVSAQTESHSTPGYLEHAQYTRPEVYKGWTVPSILLGGNHAEIEKWREQQPK